MLTGSVDKDIRHLQIALLRAILWTGIVFNALFVAADVTKINVVGSPQVEITVLSVVACAAMLLALISKPDRFELIAGLIVIQSFAQFTAALIFVPQDELRVVWFFLLIGGTYILLGRRAGFISAIASVLLLILLNPFLSRPYSPNALTTCSLALALNGVLFHIFSTFFNRLYAELLIFARHDPLTGLLNSRAYYELCDTQIRLSKRTHQPFSILFIDLDYFKLINDEHGHQLGDQVLKNVADRMTRAKRDSDFLGRVGGEEFSMFLPNTDVAGAMLMAERVRLTIENHRTRVSGKSDVQLTASIGVSYQNGDCWSMAEIEREADQAMYRAKKLGRNRVVAFDPAEGTGTELQSHHSVKSVVTTA